MQARRPQPQRVHRMDRLYALMFVAALGSACESKEPAADEPKAEPASKSRVNAVQATKAKAEDPADFCDVYKGAEEAVAFDYPSMEGTPPKVKEGWTWVNIWATWCVPCLEEMPRLAKWEEELEDEGLGNVVFISADNTAEILTNFAEKHPDLPGVTGPRLDDFKNLTPWLETYGLGNAALPVHIFVDPANKVRCVRAGGVSDNDRATVEGILGG